MQIKIRGSDDYGSGHYLAGRGDRLHDGLDIIVEPGEPVKAFSLGEVTKIGYPYSQGNPPAHYRDWKLKQFHFKKVFRYVQVTDVRGISVRYFYIDPRVSVGDPVHVGDVLGSSQDMGVPYPGIIEHFHFEVLLMVRKCKVFLNPEQYLKSVGVICAST